MVTTTTVTDFVPLTPALRVKMVAKYLNPRARMAEGTRAKGVFLSLTKKRVRITKTVTNK